MAIDALILRYSDVEASSIGQHLEVLSLRDSVWWGWWRKAHEAIPIEVLQSAANLTPIPVGLVNRRDGHFAAAICTEIHFGLDGGSVHSPDQDLTPDYYRSDSFPAWFRFEEIELLDSEAEWNEKFAGIGIPRADQTLYWIEDGELHYVVDGTEAETEGELDGIPPVESPGDVILHISDLHYGDDHGFPTGESTGGMEVTNMVDAIVERVNRLELAVGVIVVSGDLTTKSELNQLLAVAQPELERLAQRLGLREEHLVVVPGNHDIPLDEAVAATRDYRHELPFRSFLTSLYEQKTDIERLTMFRTPSGWGINTATLNSVRLRSPETKDYGYVGPRARPLMDDLRRRFGGKTTSELWNERVLNLTVLHHHLVTGELVTSPTTGHPVSVTLDAGKLISDLQQGSTHVVLHGHQHVPFVGTVARGHQVGTSGWDGYKRPLWLVGGGSAGAKSNRLSDEMRDNCFGLYTPTDQGLIVQMERFNPGHEPETFLRTCFTPT